jgi:hypothetical protein
MVSRNVGATVVDVWVPSLHLLAVVWKTQCAWRLEVARLRVVIDRILDADLVAVGVIGAEVVGAGRVDVLLFALNF